MDKINQACAANFAATDALSLGQDQITISKDSTYNVEISGGKPPFSVKWTDGKTPASNEIGAAAVGRNVVLTGRSQLPEGENEFTLQVRDSQPLPETASITVKTAGSQ